ncbi:MAG: hypothetical protein AM1032_000341 [Mycoplasmataceae bacterium]|nr:MAG: hypothetical protein AM1032_000341 [Mycoplasmataceae bacterium]
MDIIKILEFISSISQFFLGITLMLVGYKIRKNAIGRNNEFQGERERILNRNRNIDNLEQLEASASYRSIDDITSSLQILCENYQENEIISEEIEQNQNLINN